MIAGNLSVAYLNVKLMNTPPTLFSKIGLRTIVFAIDLAFVAASQGQTFSLDFPLKAARWQHTATLLTNGLVLVAGGETANDYGTGQIERATNGCELYNPVTSSTTTTGPM